MKNCRKIWDKDRLTKGLAVVMLFFSMFLFSGNVTNTQSPWQDPVKTELVGSSKRLAGGKIFSFQQAFMPAFISSFSFLPIVKAYALLHYNRRVITNTAHMLCAGLAIESQIVFLPVKIIPQSLDEHFSGLCSA